MPKAKSKRQSSSQRHKVDRKKRDAKRDLRKAAKVMKAAGLKQRSKKSRETAKLALRVSNANPDKEEILKRLIVSREAAKADRLARRTASKEEAAAASASGSDVEDSDDDRGPALLHAADERLTAKQVQQRERKAAQDAKAAANRDKQINAMKQYLFVPPGEDVGSADKQLAKIVDRLPDGVPVFLVTLDARCAEQSLPWEMLDSVVADAVARGCDRVRRVVAFTLCKADLVPLDALAASFVNVAGAVEARYGQSLKTLKPRGDQGIRCTAPVSFLCAPFSCFVDDSAAMLLHTLRGVKNVVLEGHDVGSTNMQGKLGCAVIGLPGTGKSTLCKCLVERGTDSAVAIVPCRSIRTAQTESGESKIIIPGAKGVTLVTIADDNKLKSAPIMAGDVVFHSISRVEKLENPEEAAALLAEYFDDQLALCQSLSLPAAPNSTIFLKSLGRCIVREGGFQPAGSFSGTGGSQSVSLLSASNAQGAALSAANLRKVRVNRRFLDKRNVLRVGARTFLKQFHEGKHIVWSVLRATAQTTNVDAVNLFVPAYIPKQVANVLTAGGEKPIAAAVQKGQGGVALMVLQHAMRDYAVLLPTRCLGVDPAGVVPAVRDAPKPVESDDEDDVADADDEDDEEFDDEDEEGDEELDDEDDEEFDEDDEEFDSDDDDDE